MATFDVPLVTFDASAVTRGEMSPAAAYETTHALAAISGIVNRAAPMFFYFWGGSAQGGVSSETWFQFLRQPGRWLAGRPLQNCTSLEHVVQTFRSELRGVALYDTNVSQTSLLASTAAGNEDLLPVPFRPGDAASLYSTIVMRGILNVSLSLVGRFNGSRTGSAKNDAVLWAKERYLDRAPNPVPLAYYIDWAWVKEAVDGKVGDVYNKLTVANHDFFIARRGFFFDLSPWRDEAPVDDPKQPLGTDTATMEAIFLAAYQAAGGGFVHLGGFPPWAFKYVAPFGQHAGVPTEWKFASIASSYNIFMDADACCVYEFANAALYQHFPLQPKYHQNPPPTSETLRAMGYLDPSGWVVPKNYFMFYVGDYDSASWMYTQLKPKWDDPKRGAVPLGWAFDPNLAGRFPVAFDYVMSTLTPNDRVIAGDSGAGYLNPTGLLPPRRPSALPSGEKAWQAHCGPLYDRFDINFTGFLINGDDGPLSAEAERMYLPFSSGGIVLDSGQNHMVGEMPALVHNGDLPGGDATAAAQMILGAAKTYGPLSFSVWRTILQTPSYHADVVGQVQSANPHLEAVEPLVIGALQRIALQTAGSRTSPSQSAVPYQYTHR